MGKGSERRQAKITEDELAKRWAKAFDKKAKPKKKPIPKKKNGPVKRGTHLPSNKLPRVSSWFRKCKDPDIKELYRKFVGAPTLYRPATIGNLKDWLRMLELHYRFTPEELETFRRGYERELENDK